MTKTMDTDTLITIRSAKPMVWMRIYYFNPDSDSGGQIVDTSVCMPSHRLKACLTNAKTPYDFVQSLIDQGGTVLIDKGMANYGPIKVAFEHACNGKVTEEDKKDLGGFVHYITISTEDMKDPDEYLLSIYAVLDRWRLFD